jgi:hypothetical protein
MNRPPTRPDPTQLLHKLQELRQTLAGVEPKSLAARTGSEWIPLPEGRGEFHLPLWGKPVTLTYPGFVACHAETGAELNPDVQALLLYYFTTSDGAPLAGQWISFSELPDGRFYTKAFQGYTGNELVRAFKSSYEDFLRAAGSLGGQRLAFGNAAFAFPALPRVAVLAVFWRGDEDFPASIQILFDANAGHHLSTDVCAILGSMLTRRLIKALAWRPPGEESAN